MTWSEVGRTRVVADHPSFLTVRACTPALSITTTTVMLARAPLSLRSQVTRLRVTSPARYASGHGHYHVCLPCNFPTVPLIGLFSPSAFTLCVPGQKTRSLWHQTFPLPPFGLQHSFCCLGIPAVSLSRSSFTHTQECTMQEKIWRCLIAPFLSSRHLHQSSFTLIPS